MNSQKLKTVRRNRRKMRVRKRAYGTPERPRLTVSRSLRNISAQLIDDTQGRTLVQASTLNKGVTPEAGSGGNKAAAAQIGKMLAERAVAAGISQVVFDRNGYRFHGRVRAIADAAREGGLKF